MAEQSGGPASLSARLRGEARAAGDSEGHLASDPVLTGSFRAMPRLCLECHVRWEENIYMSTALIVIDVQESFRNRPVWEQVSNPRIVERVNGLVQAARSRGIQVYWVWHAEPGSGSVFDPEMGLVGPIEGIDVREGEPQVTKTSRNAFTTTNLGQLLVSNGVRKIVVAGIQTEQCCETTARVAADLGYEVTFVTQATATFPIVRPDTGETLDADAVVERTEFALAGRFARIATIDEAFESAVTAA